MKKLILLLTLLLTSVVFANEEESDIKKYNFYWNQVPVVCAAPEEIDRWANDNNFTPLTLSYGRKDGIIYLHGSIKNRMMLSLLEQEKVSITVTHIDGLF